MAILNEDWQISWGGDHLRFTGTIATKHDADRLCYAIQMLSKPLTSHRMAVAGDFGIEDTVVPFSQQLAEFLG